MSSARKREGLNVVMIVNNSEDKYANLLLADCLLK